MFAFSSPNTEKVGERKAAMSKAAFFEDLKVPFMNEPIIDFFFVR